MYFRTSLHGDYVNNNDETATATATVTATAATADDEPKKIFEYTTQV